VNRHILIAVLITWLVISFVPSLSATSLMHLGSKGRGNKGGT
jgi:hypothetical protein